MTLISSWGFILFFTFAIVHAEDKSESQLRRALFENYDKLVRPVHSTKHVVPVGFSLHPVALRDVDVKDKEIKMDAWLTMSWEDSYLRWDESEYETSSLILPADQVWKPDISVYTSVSAEYLLPTTMTNVVVFHNGTVIWVPPITVKSRCPPTDNQVGEDTFQCTVTLGSWTYDTAALDIHPYDMDPMERALSDKSFNNAHPKWILESMTPSVEQKTYSCCANPYTIVHYDMRFRKRAAAED